ncbi:MAG: gamma-glutamyl-gamma-aminobutyrate hydrolase family protein [Clostridia bacterium]|nr:gamma-glutamyl-gamma-aminobutyrate hydrolase family protein [Clostridia bacterium]
MKQPIIGILAEVDEVCNNKVQNSYICAIERSEGLPVLLPYVAREETVEQFVSFCNGIFFTGGADIEPRRYGEKIKSTCGSIKPYRDELEFKVLKKAIAQKKPILAICRGIQLVNVALGGTLYQDISTEIQTELLHRQTEPKNMPSHEVNVMENTPLHELVGGAGRITANSFHHQAIKNLGEGLAVMATADDGMVEAVYLQNGQYLRAYQWHPERLCDIDEDNRRIFADFIEACR